MSQKDYFHKNQKGFSIIELLLSIVLGAVLVLGLIRVFIHSRDTYSLQDAMARMQENARFSHYFFTKSTRMGGYQGCASSNTAVTLVSPISTITFDNNNVVKGFDGSSGSWAPTLPTAISSTVKPDTDVIQVTYLAPNSVTLSSNMASSSDVITVPSRIAFKANDILMISDCENTDIFRATSIGSNPMTIAHANGSNTSGNLSKPYQTDARVSQVEQYTFYVADSNRVNKSGNTIFSLFRMDLNNNTEELVEGIENIQISYGVDTTSNGTADTFQTAAAVDTANNWDNVVSVRISQLLNTIEEVTPVEQSYDFNGTTVSSPGDNLIRREWNNTITVRNRAE